MAASLKACSEPTRGYVLTVAIFDLSLSSHIGSCLLAFEQRSNLQIRVQDHILSQARQKRKTGREAIETRQKHKTDRAAIQAC